MGRTLHLALGAAILVAMALLLAVDIGSLSPTIDEPFHVTRGLAWWWGGSTQLSYAHPPLANAWMALPNVLLEQPVDLTAFEAWAAADNTALAEALVQEDLARFEQWLARSRAMAALTALGFVAYLGAWCSRRWGPRTGLLAMALVAFNPSILAHARLVTTDLAVIAALFVAVTRFVDYLDGRRGEPLGFALATGAALGVKYTTATVVPCFLLIGVLWAWQGWGRFGEPLRGARLRRLGGEVLLTGAIGWLIVLALYRFEGVFWSVDTILAHPEPSVRITRAFEGGFLEVTPIGRLPGWLPIPLPYTWLYGLSMVGQQAGGGWYSWLLGELTQGSRIYFPVMLLVKTPLPIVVGLFLHLGFGHHDRTSGVLLAVAGWLGVFLIFSNLNVGVRHALPVVPLITVVVARDLGVATGARTRWLGAAAVSWVLLRAGLAQGDYLSWFNIGDRGYGVSVVGEDWGQDLDEAADALKALGARRVFYEPYGVTAEPIVESRGVAVRRWRCGQRLSRRGYLMIHRNQYVRSPVCQNRPAGPPTLVVDEHLLIWRLH